MALKNITKLILNFIGGGRINFPLKPLKSVIIDGNINDEEAVKFTPQELTEEQQNQAKENLGIQKVGPIVLTSMPNDTMNNFTQLQQIGLTKEEIIAAIRGERTGVICQNHFYQITYGWLKVDESEFILCFYNTRYDNGTLETMFGVSISGNFNTNGITVNETDN